MKVTYAQSEYLKQVLKTRLKFKDTFDEVYDHILTSLSFLPDDICFEDEVSRIIEEDMGGTKGLKRIEHRHLKLAIGLLIKEYFGLVAQALTSRFVVLLMGIAAVYYFLITQTWFNSLISMVIITFAPLIIIGSSMLRYMNRKKLFVNKPMGSVRQNMLGFAGTVVYNLPLFAHLYTSDISRYLGHDEPTAAIQLTLFLLVALHTYACYKLFASPKNFDYAT